MRGEIYMSKQPLKYDKEYKKSIVSLYQSGKSLSELSREYGIAPSTVSKWVKLYTEVKIDNNTIMTSRQIRELQKRNASLEEENLILKKAVAIFTPHSDRD